MIPDIQNEVYGDGSHLHDATLALRIVKSFPYRAIRTVVLHRIDLAAETPATLLEKAKTQILTSPHLKPFRSVVDKLDTIKIYALAQQTKPGNLIINVENDELLILPPNNTLKEEGVGHETELSVFNFEDYLDFKQNPTSVY